MKRARGVLPLCLGLAVMPFLLYGGQVSAFVLTPPPPAQRMTMTLNLGSTPFVTVEGIPATFNELAANALAEWNRVGVGRGQDHGFFSVGVAPGSNCVQNGVNIVAFSTSMCGMAWGDVVAASIRRITDGVRTEVDVQFNASIVWDSYRGPHRADRYDIFRVALHEFGHVIGLGHEDDVPAVMGTFASDIDRLQPDDIVGAHAIQLGGQVLASVLPSSRSVQVGGLATAFATIINQGPGDVSACGISLPFAPGAFIFQTTNPTTNQLVGTANVRVDIPAGAAQTFVFALTPSAPVAASELRLQFDCANSVPAPSIAGLNRLFFSAAASPIPDIVALAATVNNDGVVNIAGPAGTGVFAVATVNVGTRGTITASANTGGVTLPVVLSICETVPATGMCRAAPTSSVTTQIEAGSTPTFGVFLRGLSAPVAFDPASNRIQVLFRDASGVIRGATSVAVRTE